MMTILIILFICLITFIWMIGYSISLGLLRCRYSITMIKEYKWRSKLLIAWPYYIGLIIKNRLT